MKNTGMTASEIGMLWTQSVQSSMSVQILTYFFEKVQDDEIRSVVENALAISNDTVEETKELFIQEKIPVPKGFTEEDVNLKAPKIFTDTYILTFVETIARAGLLAWGVSQGFSIRKDIREFFSRKLVEISQLYNICTETSLTKGLYVRSPLIDIQDEVEYVERKKYFSAFSNRPLNSVEISHIFANIKTNSIGTATCTGFAQTTKSKQVQTYMQRGLQISEKHITIFSKALADSNINTPMGSDNLVTNSISPVFSDKLMLFLIGVLSATGQGNYSTASTASMRYDLVLSYQRLSLEIASYAKDGVDIMIKNGWLEEPPQAPDRRKLIKNLSK